MASSSDAAARRERADLAPTGYVGGPDASVRATADALTKVHDASSVVLVEGISDQIAVETAAAGRGRDLDAERLVVVPIGGAHAVGRLLTRLRPLGGRIRIAGLYDVGAEDVFRRGISLAQVASPRSRTDMEHLGFHACVDDLEDELIRAVGAPAVETLFDVQGDLASFRSLQRQPPWRDREPEAQMHRFLGSGSGRKLRYARLLVEEALSRNALPRPLDALLAVV